MALMATEGVTLDFTDDAIDAMADAAVQVNSTVENIGARRLQTVMERVLDEISFDASDRGGRDGHDRRRLRQRPHRRPREERRPLEVHPLRRAPRHIRVELLRLRIHTVKSSSLG